MPLTIQDAINKIIAAVPGAPFAETVDTIKLGDASQPLKRIGVTFLANTAVIEQAAQLGVNLLITHEPTFYNHLDNLDWLADNPTYQAKRRLIENHQLVIWRFHDYLHSLPPDSTVVGLTKALGWEAYARPEQPHLCHLPTALTLGEVVQHIHTKLGLATVRVVGDPDQPCRGIGLLPGFPPAEFQIGTLGDPAIDVLLAGEIHEWETSEFARDAMQLGHQKALIVLGHAASEEPGMRLIVPWLQERIPDVPIHFIPTTNAFRYL